MSISVLYFLSLSRLFSLTVYLALYLLLSECIFSLSVGVCFFLSPFLSEYIYLSVSLSIGSFSPCQCPLFYLSLFSPYSRSFIFSLVSLLPISVPLSLGDFSLFSISLLGKSLFLGKILLCVDRR